MVGNIREVSCSAIGFDTWKNEILVGGGDTGKLKIIDLKTLSLI